MQAKFNFPKNIDPEAKDLIEKLLKVDPKMRLGYNDIGEVPAMYLGGAARRINRRCRFFR